MNLSACLRRAIKFECSNFSQLCSSKDETKKDKILHKQNENKKRQQKLWPKNAGEKQNRSIRNEKILLFLVSFTAWFLFVFFSRLVFAFRMWWMWVLVHLKCCDNLMVYWKLMLMIFPNGQQSMRLRPECRFHYCGYEWIVNQRESSKKMRMSQCYD